MNEHEPQLRLRQAQPHLAIAAHGRAALRAWADAQGLKRVGYAEHFIKGPGEEGDYTKWETELAYLTTA